MSTSQNLTTLFGDAGLDQEATQALVLAADTLGPAIQAGLGDIDLDDVDTAEVVLVTMEVDDSSSICFAGNTDAVRQGHNVVIDSLKGAKQSASVLVSCQYLNGKVLYPYVMLNAAVPMDQSNYNPRGGTPLYDQTVQVLATVTAKMAEFEAGGVAARSITVIVTDGADASSRRETQASVKRIVDALLRTEQCIIAAVGIDDGYTDFRAVFSAMGIPDEWILTPGNSPSEIRQAFQTVSQSAVQASQTAGAFSASVMGGFGS